jgi:hypothetical protein
MLVVIACENSGEKLSRMLGSDENRPQFIHGGESMDTVVAVWCPCDSRPKLFSYKLRILGCQCVEVGLQFGTP